jgi:ABC-2 type transport system permease protein
VSLLVIEMRRALHRRFVRVLVLLGVLAIVVAGVVSFFTSADLDVAAMAAKDQHAPAVMVDWWGADDGDSALAVAAFFLAMGGLIGGASVVGAEWRAGTVTTLLTWEPRRLRVLGARIGATTVLAAVIACALQVLLLAAFLPSVVGHGTTAGVDGEWVWSLIGAIARIGAVTGLAAALAAALATIARNTAAAVVAPFVWFALVEPLVRGLAPERARWLLGDNATVVLNWSAFDHDHGTFSPLVSSLLAVVYAAALVTLSAIAFRHRDV